MLRIQGYFLSSSCYKHGCLFKKKQFVVSVISGIKSKNVSVYFLSAFPLLIKYKIADLLIIDNLFNYNHFPRSLLSATIRELWTEPFT